MEKIRREKDFLRMEELRREKDFLSADNDRKQQLIKSRYQELAGQEAELDDDDDDPLLHRLRRECEKRVKDCEDRLKQSQAEGEMQSILIDKIKHDLRDAQGRPIMPREVPLPCSTSRNAMS